MAWLCLVLALLTHSASSAVPASGADLAEPEPRVPRVSSIAPGELIVRYKAGQEIAGKAKVALKIKGVARDLVRPASRRGRNLAPLELTQVIKLDPAENFQAAKEALAAEPEVLYVEPNYNTRLFAAPLPNDFEFESLYALRNTGANGGRAGADIKAPEAWELSTGSRDILIAVIDTGIDYFHEDLRANIWTNPRETPGNGLDDDGNGYIDDIRGYDFISNDSDPTDDHYHGTHVAGTIGAIGNNGLGVIGVSPVARMMAVKAFNDRGNGTVAGAIAAIHYAVQNGARIINASWGLEDKSRALEEAVLAAKNAGIFFVAAAGNSRTAAPFYPAAYPSVMAVASTNNKDERSHFSNYGPHLDISAPGEQILSSMPDSRYDFASGTSMSAPHVSGVAALILANHPEFTAEEVFDILRNTTDPIASDLHIGRGRVNAFRAVSVDAPLPRARLELPPAVAGLVDWRGAASGKNFARFNLLHGPGRSPAAWTEIYSSASPVENGTLLQGFDTSRLDDGEHTFRLDVWDTAGRSASDFVTVSVQNVRIRFPLSSDILRAGDELVIRGTVFGQGRRYGVWWAPGLSQTDWRTTGLRQETNGELLDGELARFDTTVAPTNDFISIRLSATNAAGMVQESIASFVWLDGRLRRGWPVYLPYEGDYASEDFRQSKIADLDGDGKQEVLIVDHGNGSGKVARLLAYRDDGSLWWSRELNGDEPYADVPAIGDVDGDGSMEIFVDVGSTLYAFRGDGSVPPGLWPLALSHRALGKALADLDGDGTLEIVAYANREPANAVQFSRALTVYNHLGVILNRWIIPECGATNVTQRLFPVAANMDADAALEIVAVNGCDSVGVYDVSKPEDFVWSQSVTGRILSSPVVADVDADGANDILIASHAPVRGSAGGLHLLDRAGLPHRGWPTLLDESFDTAPVVGDLDGDGLLEIVAAGSASSRLHVLESDGFPANGWPVGISFGATSAYPALVDITGDGWSDVLFFAPGYMGLAVGGDPSQLSGLRAWTARGVPIELNPGSAYVATPIEGSASAGYFRAAALAAGDLDGNGLLDIVGTSIRDRTYVPPGQTASFKNRSSMYAWEFPVAHHPPANRWGEFRLNPGNNAAIPLLESQPQPPEISPIPDQVVPPGTLFHPISLNQYLLWPGLEIPNLSWVATGQSQLSVTIDDERVARVEPLNPLFVGAETIVFTVTDGATFARSVLVRFEVRPDYLPPAAQNDVAQTLEEEAVTIDLLANDANLGLGPLALLSVTRPTHGAVEILAEGRARYTPNTNFAGLDHFSYVVTNEAGAAATASAFITVINVNDAPVAADDRALTFEDRRVAINALQNDSDADGDPLQVSNVTTPANGTVVFTPERQFLYEPRAGFIGEDSFSYSISDGFGAPRIARVTVLVRALNNPPLAFPQRLTMNRNTTLDIIYRGEDPEGGDLTYRIVRPPQNGELFSYPAVGSYIPRRDFSGTDSFSYRASDGVFESNEAFVDITITATNNPPVATVANYVTRIDQPLPIALAGTDHDRQELTFRILTLPSRGTLEGSGTNYVYRPNPGYLGHDEFHFAVSDGEIESAGAKVSIEITDRNTAPAANPKLVRAVPNSPTSFVIAGVDAESNPLTYELATQPLHGALTGDAPYLVYTPHPDYVGPDRFRFRVNDGEFWSGEAAVTIMVADLNSLPIATPQTIEFYGAGPVRIDLNVNDLNGHPIECVILRGPRMGRVYGLGTTFYYVPNGNFSGVDLFTYKPYDGRGFGAEATVRLQRTLLPPLTAPGFEETQILGAGDFQLTLTNQIGRSFRIETTTNFTNWEIVTNLPSSSGRFIYQAPATNTGQFFRAIAQ